jgi:branched-chain amino acid:cation transporter, LIVCS family
MTKNLWGITITTGLAIFAMLFGAGNLIFPLKLGILSGDKTHIGLAGFMISGVILPLLGLIGMVFFDGNYHNFFYRIGKIPGALLIFFCMLIIGPLFVMPRIIALSYGLMQPFMPEMSRLLFSALFGILTFICCFKRNSIVDLLGKFLSPIKLFTLFTIIGVGFWYWQAPAHNTTSAWDIFYTNFKEGYNTLDLMGTIFFAYIIISILKKTLAPEIASNHHKLAKIMLIAGLIGGSLLALIYVGMAYLGAFHGQDFVSLSTDEKFIETIRRVMGDRGALFISITILVACLSTMIALATVVSEYLRTEIFNNRIPYLYALVLVLGVTSVMARFKLDTLLAFYVPVMDITYPLLIVLTVCNLAYKLFDFKPVKLPVLITFITMAIWNGYSYITQCPVLIEKSEEQVKTII